eukprot:Blabericola_migrator_1__10329@NODE_580_length_7497_cov_126_900135_g430_i0_p5_GENE_NODE_580_length_7497_cov_126_900135_g430_i0NODE_580_length_7497_cov_126_900135_g430_i0_p5_ORF_typecomplete_len148_score41_48_NODE_580_length_7497_cov_126_900135_g430_i058586301
MICNFGLVQVNQCYFLMRAISSKSFKDDETVTTCVATPSPRVVTAMFEETASLHIGNKRGFNDTDSSDDGDIALESTTFDKPFQTCDFDHVSNEEEDIHPLSTSLQISRPSKSTTDEDDDEDDTRSWFTTVIKSCRDWAVSFCSMKT